jgi:hypothetical protein
MENTAVGLDLGVILCKHCLTVIETFDSEKITTYYSDCKTQDCLELESQGRHGKC